MARERSENNTETSLAKRLLYNWEQVGIRRDEMRRFVLSLYFTFFLFHFAF
jgi:hypothetical protein